MRRRVDDDDILRILGAGDSGLKVADLCAAEHITPKTYYLWKVKYGELTPSELKQRRLRERLVRDAAGAVLCIVLLVAGYLVVVHFQAAQPRPAPVNAARPSGPPPVARGPARPPAPATTLSRAPDPAPASATVTEVSRAVTTEVRGSEGQTRRADEPKPTPAAAPGDVKDVDPEGAAVQVAAFTDVGDARTVRERLIGAGYPAYLTRTTTVQGEFFRVRVGPFASRAPAEEAARRLRRDGYAAAWIVK